MNARSNSSPIVKGRRSRVIKSAPPGSQIVTRAVRSLAFAHALGRRHSRRAPGRRETREERGGQQEPCRPRHRYAVGGARLEEDVLQQAAGELRTGKPEDDAAERQAESLA